MKVYKSCYRNHWISPYKILDYVFFWTDWSKCSRWNLTQTLEDENRAKSQYVEHPAWVDRWADRLSPISQAIQWVLDRVHPRVEYVKIDRWDTWSMDHTLADIVLPMLKQLKETKHGAPFTDDEDVPEYLRSHMAQPKENEWDTDSLHHMRWDWILAEMIFAFEMKCKDDWASEFHSGEIDWEWVPVDADGNEVPKGEHKYYEMKKGPKDTHQVDMEGMKKVQDRMTNGFRLFGKYYEALWD
ncbi:hypothetical protein UFOVP328_9 [uncultured Caudovirales phage]|uniref:Uncharacterized protein n=1 Tax=uncultured Caudovirales phage TaxID=2100421 RepID=A0A6J5LS82_9CAUD|nr:hypothetical protein UFOVP328_9 [uncultured Caudovirales phage]